MSTEPLPEPPVAPAAAPAIAPKKSRRRLIIAGAVLVLLVAGFVAADTAAKSYATGRVKDGIIAALKIDPATPVNVDLGGGSIIAQAMTGHIDRVTVDVPTLSFGNLTGSAHIVATNVPLDSSKPVDQLGVVVSINQENVRKLAAFLGGPDIKQIDVGNGVITFGTQLTAFFIPIPVSVDLQPSAKDGGINFAPTSIKIGANQIAVADLGASPQFGSLASTLLAAQQVCVASSLPTALKLTDVRVSGSVVVVTLDGAGAALGGQGLTTYGTCPAAK